MPEDIFFAWPGPTGDPKILNYTQFGCMLVAHLLTLQAPVTTAADDIIKYIYLKISDNIGLDISCESFAKQTIHSI